MVLRVSASQKCRALRPPRPRLRARSVAGREAASVVDYLGWKPADLHPVAALRHPSGDRHDGTHRRHFAIDATWPRGRLQGLVIEMGSQHFKGSLRSCSRCIECGPRSTIVRIGSMIPPPFDRVSHNDSLLELAKGKSTANLKALSRRSSLLCRTCFFALKGIERSTRTLSAAQLSKVRRRPCIPRYFQLYYREYLGGHNVQLSDPRNSELQSPLE